VLLALGLTQQVRGHESDQYTLPPGREFADLGDYLNRWAYETIQEGVDQTNARIRRAKQRDVSPERLAELKSPATVTVAVTRSFPSAYKVIEDLNWLTHSRVVQRRYPGSIVGYKDQFGNAYQSVHLPIDPRQFFRIWHSATIKAYGVYLGTDKIGHFTDMGRHYYHGYQKALSDGATKEEAIEAAVAVGNQGLFFAEEGALGYLTAGAYSNGDMAANYLGFQFYRNLTEPVQLAGEKQPPMLERAGDYWRIASHISPDSDFFRVFISEHLNEALNPSHFEKGMRDAMREAIHKRRAMVLWRYRDEHGQRRSPNWFETRARELATYNGQDYGHRGTPEALITIADACFRMFDLDAKPGQRNSIGHTPLHTAVLENDLAAIRWQLNRGAAVDARIESEESYNAEWGDTPLHLAARDGHVAAAEVLIEAGADVKATNDLGQTPLHKAAAHPAVARLLVKNGASVQARDLEGQTPLHWAAIDRDGGAVTAMLLKQGAAVDAQDKRGRTPLHRAAAHGRVEAGRALLQHGASHQAESQLGERPLHLAAAHDQNAMIELLLSNGAAVNAADRAGWTALHDATQNGHVDALATLLEAGANPSAGDGYGTTPLHLAARAQQRRTAFMLMEAEASVQATDAQGNTPLHEAAFGGDAVLVKALIEAGAKPAVTNNRGKSPLELARAHNHKAAAQALAERRDQQSTASAAANEDE
jgi:ankyrin repeat protein